jgi:hypothetical protein
MSDDGRPATRRQLDLMAAAVELVIAAMRKSHGDPSILQSRSDLLDSAQRFGRQSVNA